MNDAGGSQNPSFGSSMFANFSSRFNFIFWIGDSTEEKLLIVLLIDFRKGEKDMALSSYGETEELGRVWDVDVLS